MNDIFYLLGQVCDSESCRIATLELFMIRREYIKKSKINFNTRENFCKKMDVYIVQSKLLKLMCPNFNNSLVISTNNIIKSGKVGECSGKEEQ